MINSVIRPEITADYAYCVTVGMYACALVFKCMLPSRQFEWWSNCFRAIMGSRFIGFSLYPRRWFRSLSGTQNMLCLNVYKHYFQKIPGNKIHIIHCNSSYHWVWGQWFCWHPLAKLLNLKFKMCLKRGFVLTIWRLLSNHHIHYRDWTDWS